MTPFRWTVASGALAALVLVLFAATAGSSSGGGGLVTGKDIKNHSIRARDLSPALLHALRGQTGPQGAKGNTGAAGPQGLKGDRGATGARGAAGAAGLQGPNGPQGPPGKQSAAAYAYVVPPEISMQTDEVLVASLSQGFDGVTNPALGLYCLHPSGKLNPDDRSWVVSAEYSRSAGVSTAEPDASLACPAGTFGVRTVKFAPLPEPHWTAAWDVAFMVVVP